jgi:hypothetical protein
MAGITPASGLPVPSLRGGGSTRPSVPGVDRTGRTWKPSTPTLVSKGDAAMMMLRSLAVSQLALCL